MSDAEQERLIIERVKAGDKAAFRYLIERYQDDAFSLACSLLKDQALAEDILQEVFLKVFIKIKTFKYQSSFYTWLYRVVVNRCYNELRKKKYQSNNFKETASEQIATNLSDQEERRQIINNALNRMKPNEALVLRLFYLSELKIEEVMEVTGFGKSNVKVTLFRARKNLAQILKKQFGKEIEDL
ncbi:MAG: RNA polymerase sigma factor [Bacteroidota bacterium]